MVHKLLAPILVLGAIVAWSAPIYADSTRVRYDLVTELEPEHLLAIETAKRETERTHPMPFAFDAYEIEVYNSIDTIFVVFNDKSRVDDCSMLTDYGFCIPRGTTPGLVPFWVEITPDGLTLLEWSYML